MQTSKKIALLSSLLLSCSVNAQEIKPESGANLLVWTDTPTVDFMKYAAAEFNKDFNYDIDFSFRAVAPMDSVTRVIQDGGTTRVADVAEIEHDLLSRLVVAGGVMENLVSADSQEGKYMQGAVTAAKGSDGLVYGFPVSFATTALFYNKDLLEEPKTFEAILEFAQGFNNKKENKYALLWDIQNYYESRMFFALYGAYEFGNNGTNKDDIGINSVEAHKGLAALKVMQGANNSNPNDMRNPQVRRGLFAEGKVAAIVDGPWATQQYLDSGINVGVVSMPTYDGLKPRTFSTVRLAIVPAYTEYPRAAQLFADYLSSEKMLRARYDMIKSLPPMPKVVSEIIADADPASKAIMEQGQYSDAMPSIPEMGYIWSPMASAITDLWVNDKSPEVVLKQALAIVNEQIELED